MQNSKLVNYSSESDQEECEQIRKIVVTNESHILKKINVIPTKTLDDNKSFKSQIHMKGNFPAFIYINVPPSSQMLKMREKLILHPQDVHIKKEFHISLSKSFVLTYHQIQPFLIDLAKAISNIRRSNFTIKQNFSIIRNRDVDYLVYEIENGSMNIKRTIDLCNEVLSNYNQSTYFEEPIPHVTIAKVLAQFNLLEFDDQQQNAKSCKFFDLNELSVKIGKRVTILKLT